LIQFKEVNHDKDHIHFLVSIPPTMAEVGQLVFRVSFEVKEG
jgi:REP element-mobilizing transposase RayT